jgi:hypothetical protein
VLTGSPQLISRSAIVGGDHFNVFITDIAVTRRVDRLLVTTTLSEHGNGHVTTTTSTRVIGSSFTKVSCTQRVDSRGATSEQVLANSVCQNLGLFAS